MNKILLVEDDEALGLAIEFSLRNEGYEVIRASSVKEARNQFDHTIFKLAILDINLPDGNGYDLCMHFKKQNDAMSIIFLTALDEEANVVMGLDIGGDDYITKPFRVRELMSRVRVQLRKQTKLEEASLILTSENIKIDMNQVKVYKNQEVVPVTNLEYKLLLTFMKNAYKVLKRNEILLEITGDEVFFDENTLSVYIMRLRDKIEDNPKNPQFIITQRGLGYRWDKDVCRQ
ncbi:response regulator transcription factor [Lysinibacillus sp. NPDC093190]|uniref:response regulator transcription factor n=1 Tax=Lysinibacillus sp. NPDC093190 TaxID=3390575 RepID=UPI003CFE40D6